MNQEQRSTARTEPGALPPGEAVQLWVEDLARIQTGWPVYGSDGELIGPVNLIGPRYFTIAGASAYGRDMFIPQQFIETVANNRVILSKPRPLLLDMHLDEPPIPVTILEEHHESELDAENARPGLIPPPPGSVDTPHTPVPSAAGPQREKPTRIPALNIKGGWRVEDAHGRLLGVVDGITSTELKILRGGSEEVFVPIAAVEWAGDGVVRLYPI